MSPVTTILALPKTFSSDSDLTAITTRYKALRLAGLKQDPEAFSSAYEDELLFPDEKWLSRILNPEARTWICVEYTGETSSDTMDLLLRSEWLGTVTLLGPKVLEETGRDEAPWNAFFRADGSIPAEELQGQMVSYMLAGMFVLPAGRRKGNGRRMVEMVVGDAVGEAERVKARRARVLVFAEGENHAAHRFYERCGFEVWDDGLILEERNGGVPTVGMGLDVAVG